MIISFYRLRILMAYNERIRHPAHLSLSESSPKDTVLCAASEKNIHYGLITYLIDKLTRTLTVRSYTYPLSNEIDETHHDQ